MKKTTKRFLAFILAIFVINCSVLPALAAGVILDSVAVAHVSGTFSRTLTAPSDKAPRSFCISASKDGGNVPAGTLGTVTLNNNPNFSYVFTYGKGNQYFNLPAALIRNGASIKFTVTPSSSSYQWNTYIATFDQFN